MSADEKATEQQEKLALLKAEVAKVLPDDSTDDISLECFLDARKGDIPKATIMYLNMRKWRNHFDVGGYYKAFPTDIAEMAEQVMSSRHQGLSKNGNPIYWQRTGQFSPKLLKYLSMGLTLSSHMKDMEDMMERSNEQTAKHGVVKKAINVLDLSGIGLSIRALLPALKALTKMDEDYYPERLHRSFVINAPSLFSGIWSIIKGFLDPVVASKVVICSGQSSYLPKMLEEMDAGVIPKQYGGTADWELPGIEEQNVVEFFEALEKKEGMEQTTINKGEEHPVQKDVSLGTEGVAHINWKYRTNFADLGFSVKFTAEDGEEKELVSHTKAGAADSLIVGSVPVTKSGVVTVCFDNKAAYFSASMVSVVVTITPTKARHIDFGATVPPGQ